MSLYYDYINSYDAPSILVSTDVAFKLSSHD
jgi:hypothetical protein